VREDSLPGREAVFGSHTLQDAILRNLQILCESTRRVDDRYKQEHPNIPWQSIAGMRNVLVHDYFDVDFETVWKIVERDLPPLAQAMRLILTEILESPDCL
jgi:uncharacterized protein with HEPN domain